MSERENDTLWGDELPAARGVIAGDGPRASGSTSPNPLVTFYGTGPAGARCGSCAFVVRERPHDYSYIKCQLHGFTHGAGTDHRVGWPACAHFIPVGNTPGPCEGHLLAPGWQRRLPLRAGSRRLNLRACQHCAQPLIASQGDTLLFGAATFEIFRAEEARCAQAPQTDGRDATS